MTESENEPSSQEHGSQEPGSHDRGSKDQESKDRGSKDHGSKDRGMPGVGNNEKPLYLIAGGITLVVLIMGFLLYKSMSQDEVASDGLQAQVDAPFDRERIKAAPELEEKPAPVGLARVIKKPVEPVKAAPLQSPALSEEELYKRRRSPLVIYDKIKTNEASEKTVQASVSQQQSNDMVDKIIGANTASQGRSDDDDLARRLHSSDTLTAHATMLQDRPALIAQGTMIKAVIETAISSDVPGMVRAVLNEAVYSDDGSNLILAKGSRVIGEYRAGLVRGQGRLFVVWHRIMTPEGIDIAIDSPGADPLGRSGHDGWIDTHFAERFGASFLLSMVGAAASQTDDSAVAEQLGDNLNSSAELALSASIDIRPTLHKNQGEQISIFVAQDLNFKNVMALSHQ